MPKKTAKTTKAKKSQTARGKAQDKRKTAKKTLPATKENITKWRKNKGKMDIKGVDTKSVDKKNQSHTKKTVAKRRSIHNIGGGDTATISKKTQNIQQHGKLSKTAKAKNTILYEYATYGHSTKEALRAYSENRISYSTFQELGRKGMKIYKKK